MCFVLLDTVFAIDLTIQFLFCFIRTILLFFVKIAIVFAIRLPFKGIGGVVAALSGCKRQVLKDSRHVLIIVLHPISIIERIPIIGSIVFLDIAEVVPAIQGATVTHDCLQMVQIPNAFFILGFRLRKLETVGTFQDLVEVEDLSEFALAVYLSH